MEGKKKKETEIIYYSLVWAEAATMSQINVLMLAFTLRTEIAPRASWIKTPVRLCAPEDSHVLHTPGASLPISLCRHDYIWKFPTPLPQGDLGRPLSDAPRPPDRSVYRDKGRTLSSTCQSYRGRRQPDIDPN